MLHVAHKGSEKFRHKPSGKNDFCEQVLENILETYSYHYRYYAHSIIDQMNFNKYNLIEDRCDKVLSQLYDSTLDEIRLSYLDSDIDGLELMNSVESRIKIEIYNLLKSYKCPFWNVDSIKLVWGHRKQLSDLIDFYEVYESNQFRLRDLEEKEDRKIRNAKNVLILHEFGNKLLELVRGIDGGFNKKKLVLERGSDLVNQYRDFLVDNFPVSFKEVWLEEWIGDSFGMKQINKVLNKFVGINIKRSSGAKSQCLVLDRNYMPTTLLNLRSNISDECHEHTFVELNQDWGNLCNIINARFTLDFFNKDHWSRFGNMNFINLIDELHEYGLVQSNYEESLEL
jgi:hypothetical protein